MHLNGGIIGISFIHTRCPETRSTFGNLGNLRLQKNVYLKFFRFFKQTKSCSRKEVNNFFIFLYSLFYVDS